MLQQQPATDPRSPLAPFTFQRRTVGADDVRIDILY
ncbi:MAG: NAD(P)-dependent alcohol dehydrogenase, partial [Betaproteobacteria bacterium]|nr:NAD(P)-dependent alcohol dehydrogenase [Betaproteobacteria bacterium]